MARPLKVLAVFLFYSVLAALLTYPLITHLTTSLAANGQGYLFVWNTWYFNYAIEHGLNPLWTDLHHWPIGANLITHTYTLGYDIAAYFLHHWLGFAGSINLLLILSLVLAAFGGFILCQHLGVSFAVSIFAGYVIGMNPFAVARVFVGTFEYAQFWPVIFFVWRYKIALERPTLWNFFLAALFVTIGFFFAQYYFSFCLIFGFLMSAFPYLQFESKEIPWNKRIRSSLLAFFALCTVVTFGYLVVTLMRQGQVRWEGKGSFKQILLYVLPYWAVGGSVIGFVWTWVSKFPSVKIDRSPGWKPAGVFVGTFFIWTLLNASMVWNIFELARAGISIEPASRWRGGGSPHEILWYVMPNLYHPILMHIWNHFKLNPATFLTVDSQPPSLGWILPVFLILYYRRHAMSSAKLWIQCGLVCQVLALGPYLRVANFDTYIPMPFWLVRQIPVAGSNIQAVVFFAYFTYLFFGLAAALAFDDLLRNAEKPRRLYAIAFAALAFEFLLPAKTVYPLEVPALFERFAKAPPGAVLHVPFGVQLRFAGTPLKNNIEGPYLYYEMVHQHPLVGGFITRVPYSTYKAFVSDPFLLALDQCDRLTGTPAPLLGKRPAFKQFRDRWRFDYVLVDKSIVPENVAHLIESTWPLQLIDHEGSFQLYKVNKTDHQ